MLAVSPPVLLPAGEDWPFALHPELGIERRFAEVLCRSGFGEVPRVVGLGDACSVSRVDDDGIEHVGVLY